MPRTVRSILYLCLLAWLSLAAAPAQAQDFRWLDADRKPHSLAEYRGTPLLLHLWASWCPPCRAELPVLSTWRQAHPDVTLVPVSLDESSSDARDFLEQHDLPFPALLSEMREAMALGIRALPATLLIDANGEIRERLVGAQPWDDAAFSTKVLKELQGYSTDSASR